jgi:hypothetical protein
LHRFVAVFGFEIQNQHEVIRQPENREQHHFFKRSELAGGRRGRVSDRRVDIARKSGHGSSARKKMMPTPKRIAAAKIENIPAPAVFESAPGAQQ